MQTYILSIVGAVLISAVVTMIAPGGKMGKFVKGAMKLFLLVVLVAPFVSFFRGGKISVEGGNGGEIKEDPAYFMQCAELMERADEEEIATALMEEFGVAAAVEVVRAPDATFAREKISVKISDFGISGQGEHKDITDRVQAYLSGKYGGNVEVS